MGRPSPYGGIGYPQHWEKIMIWLQENWIIAVVGLVVAVVLLWWLFGRAKPGEIVPPAIEPAKPAKPLEPAKPEIIAAEPARFKPIEPKPQPVAPAAPPPPPQPVAKEPPRSEERRAGKGGVSTGRTRWSPYHK